LDVAPAFADQSAPTAATASEQTEEDTCLEAQMLQLIGRMRLLLQEQELHGADLQNQQLQQQMARMQLQHSEQLQQVEGERDLLLQQLKQLTPAAHPGKNSGCINISGWFASEGRDSVKGISNVKF
jgi:TolA-binding protein